MFLLDLTRRQKTLADVESVVRFDEEAGIFDVLDSEFLDQLRKIKPFGVREVIFEEGRLDALSFELYGTVDFWWILMAYNDIISPTEVVNGFQLRFLARSDIESLLLLLRRRA